MAMEMDAPDLEGALDKFGETALRVADERNEMAKALRFIAAHAGQTLLSMEYGQPYSIGAHDAFNQMAEVATDVLAKLSA